MARQLFSVGSLNAGVTTGAWPRVTAANVTTLDHTAAAETSTLDIEVPTSAGMFALDKQPIKTLRLQYSVATAALSGAPTATLNKITIDDATGVITRAAVTQTLTFEGTNTAGTAAGTYFAVVTPSAAISPNAGETYTLQIAFPCAATSAVKVAGLQVDTA